MKHVVLGVSGSIAAYRAADLSRELMRQGCTVRVLLTDAAENFVTKALFESLTGQPCLSSTFEEPESGRMAHIDWARWANLVVVAPATANTITKAGFGHADDMLTSLLLAYEGPVVVAPAMNPTMFSNPHVQEALQRLASNGATIVEPTEGDVACGENGQGKLASIATICEAVLERLNQSSRLKGKTVLITCGPTREAIDDVRFLSNRSSGKMGVAIAQSALELGAQVHLVCGPVAIALPNRATTVRIMSAQQMLEAAIPLAKSADYIIGAAAVADYRPANPISGKLRRSGDNLNLELAPNPDIIAALSAEAGSNSRVIGFAAEPSAETEEAEAKLVRKGLFAIAHNDVSDSGIGFESEMNELTLIFRGGRREGSGRRSKRACASWLWEQIIGG